MAKVTLIDQLRAQATSAESVEPLSRQLGADSHLFNVHLAFAYDLSHLGFGYGILIPAMISDSPGGRKSVLDLNVRERVLTGVYVNGNTLALRYWTRETGVTKVAPGDKFCEEWVSRSGDVLATGVGEVVTIDHRIGEARIRLKSSPTLFGIGDIKLPPTECDCDMVVILWSLICWGSCKCKPAPEKKP